MVSLGRKESGWLTYFPSLFIEKSVSLLNIGKKRDTNMIGFKGASHEIKLLPVNSLVILMSHCLNILDLNLTLCHPDNMYSYDP